MSTLSHVHLALAAAVALGCSTATAQTPTPAGPQFTLFGVLDMAVEWADAGLGSVKTVQSGGLMGSRWGLRGTEDLGGGLKAIFTVESGFGADTGTLQQGGRAFGRQAWVGLEGPLGQLTLGRQYSPQFWAFSRIDAFELALSAGLPVITRTRNVNGVPTPSGLLAAYVTTGRTDNSVVYTSPLWNGLRVRALAGLGEVPNADRSGFTWGASAHYTAGALDANIGYTTRRDTDGFGDLKVLSVGGSYTIGLARVFVGYTDDSNTTSATAVAAGTRTRYTLSNVGMRYRLNDRTTAIAQYTNVADKSDALPADRDGGVWGLGVVYDLSRRTALYGSVGTATNHNGSNYSLGGGLWLGTPAGNNKDAKSLILGVRHIF